VSSIIAVNGEITTRIASAIQPEDPVTSPGMVTSRVHVPIQNTLWLVF